MAEAFVLTAQLQLRAPRNTKKVIKDLKKGLKNIDIRIETKISKKSKKELKDLKKDLDRTSASSKRASGDVSNFGKQMGLAAKRYGAFLAATGAFVKLANEIGRSVGDAIAFQRELVKISQVTGKSLAELQGLTKTVTHLATSFGVASKELLGVARVLAQTGLSARDTQVALSALAKTALAPTFDDINKTAEGAVAILAQFKQGVGALEGQLGSINAVAKKFAVESSDIISAVRRTGGVFQAAGGTLEEFIALFTSVRATTRETAETIATGLRTIFTRIQRPKTIQFMREFGVELQDMEGNFVGPYEAVQRMSAALNTLDPRSADFSGIVEQLGGFRQVGKVIPLIQQMATANHALQVAMDGTNSLSEDQKTAQKALAVQFSKVREEFDALIRKVTESGSFQTMAKFAIKLASALIQVADALTPLLPMFTMLAGMKMAGMMGGFASAFGGGGKKYGGVVRGFARGGYVPGSGSGDTVPAMLQPGEFVIKKSSVNKMGAGTLQAMNSNKMAKAGKAEGPPTMTTEEGRKAVLQGLMSAGYSQHASGSMAKKFSNNNPQGSFVMADVNAAIASGKAYLGGKRDNVDKDINLKDKAFNIKGTFAGAFPEPGWKPQKKGYALGTVFDEDSATGKGKKAMAAQYGTTIETKNAVFKAGRYKSASVNSGKGAKNIFSDAVEKDIPLILDGLFGKLGVGETTEMSMDDMLSKSARNAMKGHIFEAWMRKGSGQKMTEADKKEDALMDFPNPNEALAGLFKGKGWKAGIPTDAKITNDINNNMSVWRKQIKTSAGTDYSNLKAAITAPKMARGGGVGTDTVPALLTPGEFVINKASAQSIGYGKLNRMNHVGKYAKGGPVQMFKKGGMSSEDKLEFASRTTADPQIMADFNMQMVSLNASAKERLAGFRKFREAIMKGKSTLDANYKASNRVLKVRDKSYKAIRKEVEARLKSEKAARKRAAADEKAPSKSGGGMGASGKMMAMGMMASTVTSALSQMGEEGNETVKKLANFAASTAMAATAAHMMASQVGTGMGKMFGMTGAAAGKLGSAMGGAAVAVMLAYQVFKYFSDEAKKRIKEAIETGDSGKVQEAQEDFGAILGFTDKFNEAIDSVIIGPLNAMGLGLETNAQGYLKHAKAMGLSTARLEEAEKQAANRQYAAAAAMASGTVSPLQNFAMMLFSSNDSLSNLREQAERTEGALKGLSDAGQSAADIMGGQIVKEFGAGSDEAAADFSNRVKKMNQKAAKAADMAVGPMSDEAMAEGANSASNLAYVNELAAKKAEFFGKTLAEGADKFKAYADARTKEAVKMRHAGTGVLMTFKEAQKTGAGSTAATRAYALSVKTAADATYHRVKAETAGQANSEELATKARAEEIKNQGMSFKLRDAEAKALKDSTAKFLMLSSKAEKFGKVLDALTQSGQRAAHSVAKIDSFMDQAGGGSGTATNEGFGTVGSTATPEALLQAGGLKGAKQAADDAKAGTFLKTFKGTRAAAAGGTGTPLEKRGKIFESIKTDPRFQALPAEVSGQLMNDLADAIAAGDTTKVEEIAQKAQKEMNAKMEKGLDDLLKGFSERINKMTALIKKHNKVSEMVAKSQKGIADLAAKHKQIMNKAQGVTGGAESIAADRARGRMAAAEGHLARVSGGAIQAPVGTSAASMGLDVTATQQEINRLNTMIEAEGTVRENSKAGMIFAAKWNNDTSKQHNKTVVESTKREQELMNSKKALVDVYKEAANVTERRSVIEKKLADIQAGKAQMKGAVSDFTFGTDKSRVAGAQSFNRAEFAAKAGSAQVVPEKFRADLKATLDKFSKARVFAGGTKTGEEVKKEMESDAVRRRATFVGQQQGMKGKNLQDFVGKTVQQFEEGQGTEEQTLIAQMQELNKVEMGFAKFQADQQMQMQQELYGELNKFVQDLRAVFLQGGAGGAGGGAGGAGAPPALLAPPNAANAPGQPVTQVGGNVQHTHTIQGGAAVGTQIANEVIAAALPAINQTVSQAITGISHDANGNHVPGQGTANSSSPRVLFDLGSV